MDTLLNPNTILDSSISESKLSNAVREKLNRSGGGIEEAPDDGWAYVRYKNSWLRYKYIGADMPNGVYIGYTDGTYTDYNDVDMTKTIKGVVLKTDKVKICIRPEEVEGSWAVNTTLIPDVTTTVDTLGAMEDFLGKENTQAVIASGLYGTVFTKILALGDEWYMGSCGQFNEIKANVGYINVALQKIGGTPIDVANNYYWTSTQYGNEYSWFWYLNTSMFYFYHKLYSVKSRVICDF